MYAEQSVGAEINARKRQDSYHVGHEIALVKTPPDLSMNSPGPFVLRRVGMLGL